MNCYICGHPILEGQMHVDAAAVYNSDYDKVPIGWHRAHANSADHLPTLAPGADGYAEFSADVRKQERERVVKLALEVVGSNTLPDGAIDMQAIDLELELINRIIE